ncbi:MAG: Stenotrophomonas phage Moby [Actinomycetota bacterium]
MKSIKRLLGIAVAVSLTTIGLGVMPAKALPYEGATITLVTPVLDASNTSEAAKNQAMANVWVTNGWFGEGLKYQRAFAPVGSKIILTYKVTDKNGNPLVGEIVYLRMNKQYSDSTAQIVVDGVRAKPSSSSADGGRVAHVTDQFGYVTFVVQNLDTDGEQQPAKWTDAPTISPDGLDNIHAQFLPQVLGEKQDHSVITEFHYYIPNNPTTPSVTTPELRMVAPALTDTNSIHRTDLETSLAADYAAGLSVRQVYTRVGSTNSVVYNVKDDSGNAAAGVPVTLKVGKANSGSNARLTDVTYGATNTPTNVANTNTDQAAWTSSTDAFGNVLFTLKNTDSSGIPFPATPTTPVPASGLKFSQFWLSLAGATDKGDLVEFHFTNAPNSVPAVKTAASISGSASVGKKLTANKGTWSGSPTPAVTYKWYRCSVADTKTPTAAAPAASAKCSVIAGKTANTYTLTASDRGKFIRVLVTATNVAGKAYSLSRTTSKVG